MLLSTSKRFFGLLSLLLFVNTAYAVVTSDAGKFTNYVKIGNTSAPAASAALDIVSITKGALLPRMTEAQRNAIGSPATGLMVFNTTSSLYNVYNGTAWVAIGSSPLTTDGDIFTRAGGVDARLGIGTSGFILTSTGTAVSWAAAPISGITALTGDVSASGSGSVVATIGASKVLTGMIADGTIVNADISASAGIGVTKLAALTINRVTSTDSSGFLTVSPITSAGAGFLSSITEDLQTALDRLANLSRNYLRAWYEPLTNANITMYNDGVSATPVDGTGGVATGLSVAVNTASTPLRTRNLRFTKDAANRQGMGWGLEFTLDRAEYESATPMVLRFKYRVSSGYVNNDVRFFIYNRDGSVLYNVSSVTGDGSLAYSGGARFTGMFTPSTTADDYRMVMHVAGTTAAAWDIDITDFEIVPYATTPGAIITDWQAYSPQPTLVGFGTPTGVAFEWRRNGDSIDIRGKFTAGTSTAVEARIPLPNGYTTAGVTKIPTIRKVGDFGWSQATGYLTSVHAEPSQTYLTMGYGDSTAGQSTMTKQNGNGLLSTGNGMTLQAWGIPIANLAASAALSTTDTMLMSAKFTARKTASQTGLTTAVTKVTWSTTGMVDNLGAFDSTNNRYSIKKTGRYNINAGVNFANNIAENYALWIYVNGAAVRSSVTHANASGSVTYNVPLDLISGDYVEIFIQSSTDAAYDIVGPSNATWFSVSEAPDFSIFSTYGNFEILTATSAVKTPAASGQWQALTTNSLTLSAGTWRLWVSALFGDSGASPVYAATGLGFYGANGGDAGSSPALLSTVSGLTVLTAQATGLTWFDKGSGENHHAPPVIVRCTSSCTVYAVSYAQMTTASNSRITVYGNAERLQ